MKSSNKRLNFLSYLFTLLFIIIFSSANQLLLAQEVNGSETAQQQEQAVGDSGSVEDRREDHEALRALLKIATEALNKVELDTLAPYFMEDATVTSTTQDHFTGFSEFKTYYEGLFSGSSAILKSVQMSPKADDVTRFVSENVGICSGTSNDTYTFKDGETRAMPTRWTATVVKDAGVWKVASLHLGANFLNNPVVDAVQGFLWKVVLATFAVGLLLGWLVRKLTSV